jgi:hypothetical protein
MSTFVARSSRATDVVERQLDLPDSSVTSPCASSSRAAYSTRGSRGLPIAACAHVGCDHVYRPVPMGATARTARSAARSRAAAEPPVEVVEKLLTAISAAAGSV